MDIPVPSICFSAYSFSSFLYTKKKNRNVFSSDLNYTNQYKYNITTYFNLVWIKKLKSQSGFMDKLHLNIKSKFPFNTDFNNSKQKLPYKETLLTDIHFSLKPHR